MFAKIHKGVGKALTSMMSATPTIPNLGIKKFLKNSRDFAKSKMPALPALTNPLQGMSFKPQTSATPSTPEPPKNEAPKTNELYKTSRYTE